MENVGRGRREKMTRKGDRAIEVDIIKKISL